MSETPSLLELFHPEGTAFRSVVLGGRCPQILRPCSTLNDSEHADLVILAPTHAECLGSSWLREAVRLTSRILKPDGVAYILVSRLRRFQTRKLLSDHGLVIGQEFIHLPDQEVSRYLVPVRSIPVRYAFSKLLPLPQWVRTVASLGSRVSGFEALLSHLLPSAGMAVRRPGARPLFDWLLKLSAPADRSGSVIIRTSWRGKNGALIFYRFIGRDDSPSAVVKMNLTTNTDSNLVREAQNLERLGPSARSAGAEIPRNLLLEHVHGRPVFLQTMIGGQTAASVLTSRPRRLTEIMDRLIMWLESWNRSTMVARPLDQEFLERELLSSVTLLRPVLEQAEAYRNWLVQRCSTVAGTPAPLVAAHHDLTTWNILLSEQQQQVGVIDWESASEKGLPFTDYFYAVTDAVTVAQTNGDRLRAFKECFAVGGTYEGLVRRYLTHLRRAVPVADEMVGVCFHACWLQHGVNEYRSTGLSDPQPFVQVVRWLSSNRADLCEWVHG